jgi:G6PDH family F420-dependent oxidoreductase
VKVGYFLSSEQNGAGELVAQARGAEEAGFAGLWISDHFHPWNGAQGHSPFVWSTIGALSQAVERLPVTTAVTCPTVRIHPAIIAQAAATSAVLLEGRFRLGVGSGEALNEHILASRWPQASERLEMLEEAIAVIRLLWAGSSQSHDGRHYRVENAQIYDLPEQAPAILVSGFGPNSIELAARVGDGFATVKPDADAVKSFREQGGGDKLVQGGMKVCYDADEANARRIAHRLWPNDALGGELAQILPTPAHFEQACEIVDEQMVADKIPCGPDIDRHLELLERYEQAGFDEVYVQQVGPDLDGFFTVYEREVLSRYPAAGERGGERRPQGAAAR